MTSHLRSLSHSVNHKRIQRLIRKMDLEAVYSKPNTSLPNKEHTIYPYLLKGLKITRPNQVWATDIKYIPMAKGFMYLIAIVDLYFRKVLTLSVSNTMDDVVHFRFTLFLRVCDNYLTYFFVIVFCKSLRALITKRRMQSLSVVKPFNIFK